MYLADIGNLCLRERPLLDMVSDVPGNDEPLHPRYLVFFCSLTPLRKTVIIPEFVPIISVNVPVLNNCRVVRER
jgi:hypothetical protein